LRSAAIAASTASAAVSASGFRLHVAPLAFLMPTSATWRRNPLALTAALAVDAAIAADRNQGVDASRWLPAGKLVSAAACRRSFDGVRTDIRSAGAMWYDYATTQGDRLTLSVAIAAAKNGAVLANYAEAGHPLRDAASRVTGVSARDRLTGAELDVRARVVVNAAGPWAAPFLSQYGIHHRWPLLKAMNLVTTRPARSTALVSPTRGGRALVLLPWQGRTLIGTSESAQATDADDQSVASQETASFLEEINDTFPALKLTAGEVSLVHRGVVPAASHNGRLSLLGRSEVLDHAREGARELISIVGVKYTTARAVAERAVDLVLRKLGHGPLRCRTAEEPLPGASLADQPAVPPTLSSQVLQAVRSEMAQTLIDVVVRRTGRGAAGYPDADTVLECARTMQRELGWSEETVRREMDELKKFYEIG
jgi:glycerol-3-phosphate dehydrogenase